MPSSGIIVIMRSLFAHTFVKIIAAALALVLIAIALLAIGAERSALELKRRPDKGFSEINLPQTFAPVSVVSKTHSGDLITSSLVAQARTYKVAMNMEQTKDSLVGILAREQDTKADADSDNGDTRRSMHTEDRAYQLADSSKTCSPIEIPLKSNTFATVIFGDTQASVTVALDEDGNIDDGSIGTGGKLKKYVRPSCSTNGSESYVTIVMWAM